MQRRTIVALGVFAVLLVATLASAARREEGGISRLDLSGIDTSTIDTIVIEGEETTTLVKDGENWKTDGRRADQSAVDAVLKALGQVKSTRLVTQNPDRFATYEVDDEKGLKVTYQRGDTVVARLVIGKGIRGGTNIRVGDEVYAVKGVYRYTFDRKKPRWYDLRLFPELAEADLSKVKVDLASGESYTLVRGEDGTWSLESGPRPQGFRFDAQQAKSLVSTLVSVRAKDIEAGPAKPGANWDTLTLETPTGSTVLKIAPKAEGDSDVKAVVQGREDVYVLYAATADRLRRPLESLRDLSLVSVDPEKVVEMEISGKDGRVHFVKKDGTWTLAEGQTVPDGFELDPALVDSRVRAVARARAMAVAAPTDRFGPDPGNTWVKLVVAPAAAEQEGSKQGAEAEGAPEHAGAKGAAQGETVLLRFGKEVKDGDRTLVLVRGNADDLTYRAATYLRDSLTSGLDAFKKRPPMAGPPGGGFDPEQLKGLPPEVRKQLMQQLLQGGH